MEARDLEYKKNLLRAMDKAEQAKMVSVLLEEWLADYQGLITDSLKTCPVKEVMDLRNKLVVSEDFKNYLSSQISNGKLANHLLEELEERNATSNNSNNWYDSL